MPLEDRPEKLIKELNAALAAEIRLFLLDLVKDDGRLGRYVRDRIAFLRDESGLSEEAQDVLLDSDFSRIHAVMKEASPPTRWLVIWIV